MYVGLLAVQLHLPGNHSLKAKRRIIKSLQDRMKHRFNISMAEVAEQDRHQAAQLALAYVSHDAQQVDITLNKLLSYIHEQAGMYYVVEHDMDVLQFS